MIDDDKYYSTRRHPRGWTEPEGPAFGLAPKEIQGWMMQWMFDERINTWQARRWAKLLISREYSLMYDEGRVYPLDGKHYKFDDEPCGSPYEVRTEQDEIDLYYYKNPDERIWDELDDLKREFREMEAKHGKRAAQSEPVRCECDA